MNRYIKEKRMIWPLTIVIALGALPGVFLGVHERVVWLPDPKQFNCSCLVVVFRLQS